MCACVLARAVCVSPIPQVVEVNRMFIRKIEKLSDSTNSATVRLQLFIQWWVEYSSNYDKICPWLKRAESRLEQLVVREESVECPTVSPVELLQDAKVCGWHEHEYVKYRSAPPFPPPGVLELLMGGGYMVGVIFIL